MIKHPQALVPVIKFQGHDKTLISSVHMDPDVVTTLPFMSCVFI